MQNLDPPPRKLTLGVIAKVLMGRKNSQSSCFFFMLMVFMSWLLIFRPILLNYPFGLPQAQTEGKLLEIQKLSTDTSAFTKGRSPDLYSYTFQYAYQGQNFSAVSYAAGPPQLALNAKIPVKFLAAKPRRALLNLPKFRVTSLNGSDFIALSFLLLLGILGWGINLLKGFKLLNLIKNGKTVKGKLIRKADTGILVVVNNQKKSLYQLIYSYTVGGKIYESILKTHALEGLSESNHETLLYLTHKPNQAISVLGLAEGLSLQKEQFESQSSPVLSFMAFILPGLAFLLCCGICIEALTF